MPDDESALQCPHAQHCPGCPMIEAPAQVSAAEKRARVAHAIARFADIAPVAVSELRRVGPQVAYRQRAKLVADEAGRLGLYRAGTHDVEDLPGCIVLDPRVQASVALARELLREQPILRGLDVVRVDEGTLVTLITPERADDQAVQAFADRLMTRDVSIRGVARSQRAEGAVQLLGTNLRVLQGAGHARHSLRTGGPYAFVAHGSFVQAHREVARSIQERLVSALQEAGIEPPARVLELYAGSGQLALALAQAGFAVTAVESFAPACQQLREAAREQGLRIHVENADAAQGARRLFAEGGAGFAAVLVNPPRRGLDPEVRRALARLGPKLVTYVSCEPNTLARDLSHLASLGYAARELAPFDMMPLTDQVETVAILARAERPPLEVLHEDEALLAVDKRPFEPVTPGDDDDASSLLERVRLREGFERAVAIAPLDRDASGVCLFARDAPCAEHVVRALELGETVYLALVRGVVRQGGKIARAIGDAASSLPVTRFRRQEVVAGHSLLRASPLAREHPGQLIRHFARIGHPVLGTRRHGDARSNRHLALKHMLDRAFLHRARVTLALASGPLTLEAPLAPDLALSLESLRSAGASRLETP